MKRYTIAGDNPVWQVVEPVLLRTWAQGMLKATSRALFLCNASGLLMAQFFFILSLVWRVMVIGVLIGVMLVAFGDLFQSALLAPFHGSSPIREDQTIPYWVYQLVGFVVLIKSVLFVFGSNFSAWVRDTSLFSVFILTGGLALRWMAKGLLSGGYFPQLAAKSEFMGVYIASTMAVAPPELKHRFDRLYDLYLGSNDPEKRQELEALCGEIWGI
ncbi:MAG: hypothetical protein ACYCWC_01045 [Rhodocyclaceae bacterium]